MSTVLQEREVVTEPTPNATEKLTQALVQYNGNLKLISEKLKLPEGEIIEMLASDKLSVDGLTDRIRIKTLLKTYSNYMLLADAVALNVENLDNKEFIKLFGDVSAALTDLVGKPENTLESILKALPPNVRDSVVRLMAG